MLSKIICMGFWFESNSRELCVCVCDTHMVTPKRRSISFGVLNADIDFSPFELYDGKCVLVRSHGSVTDYCLHTRFLVYFHFSPSISSIILWIYRGIRTIQISNVLDTRQWCVNKFRARLESMFVLMAHSIWIVHIDSIECKNRSNWFQLWICDCVRFLHGMQFIQIELTYGICDSSTHSIGNETEWNATTTRVSSHSCCDQQDRVTLSTSA